MSKKLSDMAAQQAIDEAKRAATAQPVPSHVRILANRILKAVDGQAEAARARIKARAGSLFAGVDPQVLYDVSVIGASHILHGLDNFAAWSGKMVEEFTDKVTPHLQTIWDESQKRVDEQAKENTGGQASCPPPKSRARPSPQTRSLPPGRHEAGSARISAIPSLGRCKSWPVLSSNRASPTGRS